MEDVDLRAFRPKQGSESRGIFQRCEELLNAKEAKVLEKARREFNKIQRSWLTIEAETAKEIFQDSSQSEEK